VAFAAPGVMKLADFFNSSGMDLQYRILPKSAKKCGNISKNPIYSVE
jgi:hypothetical protein